MHLLHHVNLEVMTAVHLAHVARKDFSNTHVSIVRDVKLDPAGYWALRQVYGRGFEDHKPEGVETESSDVFSS